MSNEEKKAIKGLEWSQQQMRLGNLPDYDQGHYADIRIILNLIEKQQKEIEELKVNNKKLQDKAKELIYEKQQLTSALLDSTPNDKIKAKIDYLLKQYDSENFINFEMFIKILQSLLEKE